MFNFMAANLHAPTATIKEMLCLPLLATPNINLLDGDMHERELVRVRAFYFCMALLMAYCKNIILIYLLVNMFPIVRHKAL
jgi:hypothetical protein